jgi:hypothetical protein
MMTSDMLVALTEDICGANGGLDYFQIQDRLIENIHHVTGFSYKETGTLPVETVAKLIRAIWEIHAWDIYEAVETTKKEAA